MQTPRKSSEFYWTNNHMKRSTEKLLVAISITVLIILIVLTHTRFLSEFRYNGFYYQMYFYAIFLGLSLFYNTRFYIRISADYISVRTLNSINSVKLKNFFFNNRNKFTLPWRDIRLIEIALLHINLVTDNNLKFKIPFFYMNYNEIKDLKSVIQEQATINSIELHRIG